MIDAISNADLEIPRPDLKTFEKSHNQSRQQNQSVMELPSIFFPEDENSRQHPEKDVVLELENIVIDKNEEEIDQPDQQGQVELDVEADLETGRIEHHNHHHTEADPINRPTSPINPPVPQENNQNQAVQNSQNIQVNPVLTPLRLQQLQVPEAKMYLAKAIGLFLTLIAGSIYVLFMKSDEYPVGGMLAVGLGYVIYIGALYIFWVIPVLANSWLDSYDVFKFWDLFNGALALLFIHLNLTNLFPKCSFICVPFLLILLISLMSTKGNVRDRKQQLLRRCYYALQVTILLLKVEDNLYWDWKLVLIPSYAILAFTLIYFIKFFSSLCLKFRQHNLYQNTPLPKTVKLLGSIWYLAYYALAVFAGLALLGAARVLDEGKWELLNALAYIGIIANVVIILFTGAAWNQMIKFIITFGIIDSHMVRAEIEKLKKKGEHTAFQMEKKEKYFLMLSPSYFVPFTLKSLLKDEETLNKVKTITRKLKLGFSKIMDTNTSLNGDKIKEITTLKEFGGSLSKFNREKVGKVHVDSNKSAFDFKTIENLSMEQNENKYGLSMNDIDEVLRLQPEEKASKDSIEEPLCYVCYKNTPNVIFTSCGHGGVCYECAVASMEKKANCIECRSDVQSFYKIEPAPKLSNIVKGIELIKVIVNKPVNKQ